MKKIVLVTTLYRLRKCHACKDRYAHLVDKLGPKWGDQQPINLLGILEYNGIADCLWAFRAVKHPEGDQVMRLMAADFAEVVLPIFEKEYPSDTRPRKAIQAARDFANGKITLQEEATAGDAAWYAAWAAAQAAARAAGDAAQAAAWAAAQAATGDIAWDAAQAAAGNAAWAAAQAAAQAAVGNAARAAARDAAWAVAWAAQAKIIHKYLRA